MFRSLVALLSLCLTASAVTLPRPLANVIIQTPDRKNIDLKKYRGKVLLVVLFLTECDDCNSMMQFAQKLEADYGSRGFQVIGAAVDDNAPYLVANYIQRYRPNFPIGYLNKPEDIVKILDLGPNVRPIAPMIMFVDHKGNVRFQYSGKDKAVMSDKERNLRVIAGGLLKQRDENQEPVRVVK